MGAITDSIENYDVIVSAIRNMAVVGKSASQILNYLVKECAIEGKVQLIILFRKGLNIELEKANCIGGWCVDGSGELSDDQIDELLNSEINNYVLPSRNS